MAKRVSFCFPQEVEVRALRILIEESAFSLVILEWSPKLKLGSSVSPKILGFFDSWNDDIINGEVQCNMMFMGIRCKKSGSGFVWVQY